jgi:hypothetical protein
MIGNAELHIVEWMGERGRAGLAGKAVKAKQAM